MEETKKELPIDLILNYAKEDFVKGINETVAKYNLSIGVTEMIIFRIYNEICNLHQNEIEKLKGSDK